MKTFKEYIEGTSFCNYFDDSLLPNTFIRGKRVLEIYKDYIGDNMLMRNFLINSWMDYFRYYLNIQMSTPHICKPIR